MMARTVLNYLDLIVKGGNMGNRLDDRTVAVILPNMISPAHHMPGQPGLLEFDGVLKLDLNEQVEKIRYRFAPQ